MNYEIHRITPVRVYMVPLLEVDHTDYEAMKAAADLLQKACYKARSRDTIVITTGDKWNCVYRAASNPRNYEAVK